MTNNGDLLIDSSELSGVVSTINTIVTTLESDIGTAISSEFTALSEAGLFTDGLASLAQSVQSLGGSYKQLAVLIASHNVELEETENQLSNAAGNYSSGYKGSSGSRGNSGGSSGSSGGNSSYDNNNTNVNDVNDGQAVNAAVLVDNIEKITDESLVKLVDFIKINKAANLSINQLLFDKTNAMKLVSLLRVFYGDKTTDTIVDISSATLIQKTLIKQMFEADTLPQEISNNTILVAKEYLNTIAKENKIAVEDLLLDDDNSLILATSLMNVYDGNGISEYGLSAEEVEKIRNYMDNVATSNGASVEDIAGNPDKFLGGSYVFKG